MKSIIFSDIHNRVDFIDLYLESQNGKYDELVFLGDYFDHYGDSSFEASKTAYWLREALHKYPNAHFLFGNHDMPYVFPSNPYLECPGWTGKKSATVNRILSRDDWNKLKLCHFTQGFLCSHAGLSYDYFAHDFKVELPYIEKICKESLEMVSAGFYSSLLGAGRDRGGPQTVGGILWVDFRSFKPLPGFNQIVGHTEGKEVRSLITEDSKNYCLDTSSKDIGIIEDGEFYWTFNPFLDN